MKTAKKFLIKKINELSVEFNKSMLCLAFDKLTETFYIKISPAKSYLDSEKFEDRTIDIMDEFLELFPNESVVFVTDESLVQFTEFEHECKGVAYYCDTMKTAFFNQLFINNELELKQAKKEYTEEPNYALAA